MEKILFVDDEENILAAFQRQLRKHYALQTANSGAQGLEILREQGPFAVVVADLRMPGMDGVQFLARTRDVAPDTVRMMLTGYADLETAIEAVNEGNIFRFLTKPCPTEALVKALESGIAQYRLVNAERDLIEKTLKSSIRLLTEILSLANPTAFGRSLRLQRIVRQISLNLRLFDSWQYELAAMLSQIGCIGLPEGVLERVHTQGELTSAEASLYASHPLIGARLLQNIARLEDIAGMIRFQLKHYRDFEERPIPERNRKVELGAQVLKVALDYDTLIRGGMGHAEAVQVLKLRVGEYNPALLDALGEQEIIREQWDVALVTLSQVSAGMILDEDVHSKDGRRLFTRHQEITLTVLETLEVIAEGSGIVEPFRVLVPSKLSPSS